MADLVKLVEHGITMARAGKRDDLSRRLEQTRTRLMDPSVRVIVVGEFKQGKSQLINALVNAPVCPVDDDIATSVPTVVRHGSPPSAAVLVAGSPGGEAEPKRVPIEIDELAAHVSEKGNPGNKRGFISAEVCLPRKILSGGLTLIDSPGVGGFNSVHSLTTLTALPTADAMLLVSDASQEYTEPEMRFIRQAMRVSPNVACVLTKTDLYPQWRKVLDLDREHLNDGRPEPVPLFPVSSELRLHAARLEDQELNDESGFPQLIKHLREEIVGNSERNQEKSVRQDLLSVIEHLRLSLNAELAALQNPNGTPQLIADLELAKEKSGESRKRSARWQVALNDGMSDLISDMEHDLRDRLRKIQREAEQAIDQGDPGKSWEQFTEWLEERCAEAIADTFVWTNERAQWLAGQVAECFDQDELTLPALRVDETDDVMDPVEPMPHLDPGHVKPTQKILIGMRGSYGGVLMFGLLTGVLGMALINPISIGAGLLLGGKAYKEDMQGRLQRRQGEAKNLVRRQIDDVIFQVGKQLKDRLRLIQRSTRDHFSEIAEEHHRSLAESVTAAQKAASTFSAEREQRIKAIKTELERVDVLHRHASALMAPSMITAGS